jgi:hypothetical protein
MEINKNRNLFSFSLAIPNPSMIERNGQIRKNSLLSGKNGLMRETNKIKPNQINT